LDKIEIIAEKVSFCRLAPPPGSAPDPIFTFVIHEQNALKHFVCHLLAGLVET
jgi:hypothetical protein